MQSGSRPSLPQKQKDRSQPLLLCYYYQQNGCNNISCPRLHLCKDFLIHASFCSNNDCKFGYSHDPFDKTNSAVLEKHGLKGVSKGAVLEKLRQHFPRICRAYEDWAKCLYDDCKRLHICVAFLFEICKDEDCNRSHNFRDFHNSRVLAMFSLERIQKKHYLLANILKRRNQKLICESESESEYELESSCEDEDEADYDTEQEYEQEYQPIFQVESGPKNSYPHDFFQVEGGLEYSIAHNPALLSFSGILPKSVKNPVSTAVSTVPAPSLVEGRRASFSTVPACSEVEGRAQQDSSIEPSKKSQVEDIFTTLVKVSDSASLDISDSDILKHFSGLSPKPDDLRTVMNWFAEHQSTFRLSGPDDNTLLSKKVHACVWDIKPCTNYWSSKGCDDDICRSFHVCKKWLCGIDHSTLSCKLNHDLTSTRRKVLVQGTYLDRLSDSELIKVLRNRYPYVCMENYERCDAGPLHCPNLHVCYDYVMGICKKREALCNHKHDCAFTGIQAVLLRKDYHISKEDFEDAILLPKMANSPLNPGVALIEPNQDFNFLKEAAICHNHAGSVCTLGNQCSLLHTKDNHSYLWQCKDSKGDTWISLDQETNTTVESYFCHPVNDSAKCNNVHIFFAYDKSKKSFNGTAQQNPAVFRRLSTKSHNGATGELGLTDWIWYWKKSNTEWEEYTKWVTSQDLEKSYLGDRAFHRFTTDEFDYIITFEKMEQQNLDDRYRTKRNIRRRPTFQSCVRTEAKSIPSHWPENCPQGQRINVLPEIYKNVEREFKSSLRQNVYVLNIEEICNEEYYEKYEGKKRSLARKLGEGKVNERFLYHGTDDTTVTKVCAQNFDWRLCGKNGTAYGDGSYFARDASYSHTYSRLGGSSIRYMFLANVLVGRTTKGNSGLKRPPPIMASEIDLYDSCVDNINDPSIFVIFERDQCYPKYLISYTEDSWCARTYRSPTTSLNPRTVAPRAVAHHAVARSDLTPRPVSPRSSTFTVPPTPTSNTTSTSSCVIS